MAKQLCLAIVIMKQRQVESIRFQRQALELPLEQQLQVQQVLKSLELVEQRLVL